MGKINWSKIFKAVQSSAKKHTPEILTGIGITGLVSAGVMAVRATPKALMLIEEKKYDYDVDELTKLETIKTTWTCYVPSVIVGGMSVCCLIGASSVNFRRNAALATAYRLSESALKEYQEKVVEVIGEKKEQNVRDSIVKDKIDKTPVTNREVFLTEKGNTLCLDLMSKRYFRTDIDMLKRAVNDLNRRMRDEMFISLNDFYYEIGLDGIKLGDDLGWNIDRGYIDLQFSSQLANDETPCLVIDYEVAPEYDYR